MRTDKTKHHTRSCTTTALRTCVATLLVLSLLTWVACREDAAHKGPENSDPDCINNQPCNEPPTAPTTDDKLCPDGSQPVQCLVNPCDHATCAAQPNAKCEPNYCGGCDTQWFIGEEKIDCQTPTPCQEAEDCPANQWCRPTCDDNTLMQCVPYAQAGEPCEGYTTHCELQKCAPDLNCVDQHPLIADEPGICESSSETTCQLDGVTHQQGTHFHGANDNWCNTCHCSSNGLVICTKMGCPPNPCIKTGCSSQICSDEEVHTTCEWKPEYACHQELGQCAPFGSDGICQWDTTQALQQCLDAHQTTNSQL